MKELRRKDRAISDEDAVDVLKRAEYGVLSTLCADGSPYGVPLNFCLVDIVAGLNTGRLQPAKPRGRLKCSSEIA